MKTEITHQYNLNSNQEVSQVLPFNNTDFAVLTYQSGKPILNIHGTYERQFSLPNIKKHNELNSYCSLFKYKNGFGLAERFGKLSLCQNLSDNLKIIQLKHPFLTKSPNPFLSLIVYREADDSFVVGIEEEISAFFPSKYWARVKLEKKKLFGFNLPQLNQRLEELRVLGLNKFPATKRNYSQDEWLSIQNIGVNSDKLLIHTNGGSATRTKSGPDFEFSIISEFDRNLQFIDNHIIEKGKVFFSADSKHLIIHSQKNKKLFVYNKDNFQMSYEISLTSKQNLGEAKPKYISVDILEDNLYVFGKGFLNICKMIK